MLRHFLKQTMLTWRASIKLKTENEHNEQKIHTTLYSTENHNIHNITYNQHKFWLQHQAPENKRSQNQSSPVFGRYKNIRYHGDAIEAFTQNNIHQTPLHQKSKWNLVWTVVRHINKNQWKNQPELETLTNDSLDDMNEDETYKYLSFHNNTKMDHTEIKKWSKSKNCLTKLLGTWPKPLIR